MVKLKALDTFYTDETKQVRSGDVFEVSENHAQELVTRGLAAPAETKEPAPPQKVAKRTARK